MKKAALISVSNKTGVEDFAKSLVNLGYEILTTGGTGKALAEAGVPFTSIEDYTGQKEILNGRVKTLHPKIHAGILARRDDDSHMNVLKDDSIMPIELVVVNLYPFSEGLTTDKAMDPVQMIELVDIGGPTMLRSAAKNYNSVYSIIDPQDYDAALEHLSGKSSASDAFEFRRYLMTKVFTETASYDLAIARYFDIVTCDESGPALCEEKLAPGAQTVEGVVLKREEELRYGENPHQRASFYVPYDKRDSSWTQLQGKALSYNNLLDFSAATALARQLPKDKACAAILKHLNPCGAAMADTVEEALVKAKQGDPRSHFGGIIVANKLVDDSCAQEIVKDFTEIVVAPEYTPGAKELLSKKKNVRVIELDFSKPVAREMRSVEGGVLIQEPDPGVSSIDQAEAQTERKLSAAEKADLQLAWTLCAHLKSNAICLVSSGMLLASGAGQMSRIDAVEVALMKARMHDHDLSSAVAASDAFFPFPDCVEVLAEAGVKAIVVPGGSKGDEAVIKKAQEVGISLLFVTDRHFRH